MRISLIIIFLAVSLASFSQTVLTINGQTYVNTQPDNWNGVEIPRDVPTTFTFSNNSITSISNNSYMLNAGDEIPQSTNNNLDGEVITGNKLLWNGTDENAGIHGIFVGFNKNWKIQYNYLEHVPYGIVVKSGTSGGVNMTNTSGGIAYNILKNSFIGIRIKGMNGVYVYNNTFFDDMHTSFPGFIYITANDGASTPAPSVGTKIKNNIFYLKNPGVIIHTEAGSEQGLECDYNVYYCENGSPTFIYNGSSKSFSQWQALGYDTHSVIVNPRFLNTTELVPSARLDYGYNLGTVWNAGLSVNSIWGTSDPAKTTQNGAWQVGARVYGAVVVIVNPEYTSSQIQNATPSIVEMNYNLSLAAIVPAPSAFTVTVNSVQRTVSSVSISGTRVLLTLSSPVVFGDIVKVSYSKPANNPIQTASGGQATNLVSQPVTNSVIYIPPIPPIDTSTVNILPAISFISPLSNSSFFVSDTIVLKVEASDPDGSIKSVQFSDGNTIIGEKATSPYTFRWKGMSLGSHVITAVATDNLNATASAFINIIVNQYQEPKIFSLYPNPNDGRFSISFINPIVKKKSVSVFDLRGKLIFSGMLTKDEIHKEFDLQFIDPGIYVLVVSENTILFVEKFIKN